MDYKKLIIDMINQMENENFLWKIYSYIRVAYLKEKFPEKKSE